MDPPDVPARPAEDPMDEVLVRLVWRLPPRQPQVVGLRVLLDLSVEETASIMKVSAGTVKASLNHALASLRASLEGNPSEEIR